MKGRRKHVGDYLSLVKFSHSIFALPFALQGAWLAADGVPAPAVLALIVACAVAARTAAMAFNRLIDRDMDARNPRTVERELPAGVLSPVRVAVLVALSSAVFIAAAFALGPLAGKLSLPVLGVLLGYSYVKRFSAAAHLVLGLALALAPLGAWIAVRGTVAGDLRPILFLALAVWTWVAGFDLIYACQDAEFDREEGLHSIPARFGVPLALRLSSILHVVTAGALYVVMVTAGLSWIYGAAIAATAVLLVAEHRVVRPDDLSRVNMAFFTLNGWIGVALFVGLVLDIALLGAGGGLMAQAKKGSKKKAARKARDPHPEEELAGLAQLLASELPRAVVLRGEERFFRDAGVRQVLAAATRNEYELCRHDAADPEFDLPSILDDLTGGALFATARCVVLQNAEQVLKKGAKRYSPGLQAALLARIAHDAPGVLVLSANALRADHVVVKAVKAAGGVLLGCRRLWDSPPPWDPDPRRAELVQWLVGAARERNVQLAPDEAAYVAAATGNDLYGLVSQLDRLRGRGAAGVRELVGWDGGGTPWTVADHMVSIDVPRSLAGIESLFSGGFHGKDGTRTVDTAGLSAMLSRAVVSKLREFVSGAVVIEQGGSPEQAAAAAGIGSPMAKKAYAARVGTRPPAVWRAMHSDACDIERRTRTWSTVDASDFYGLVLRWAKRHAARGRRPGMMPR